MRISTLILLLAAAPPQAFPVKRCVNLGNAFDAAPPKDAARWLAFVREAAESAGLGWCACFFTRTFGLFDLETDDWIAPRLHALIPPE